MNREPAEVTVIRSASWVVAWQPGDRCHGYLTDADVAFTSKELVQVGGHYEGPVTNEVPGRNTMVMPGLINIHSHPSTEPLRKGITDEIRSPNFYHSSLYEFLTVFDNDLAGKLASSRVAMAELLRSGCTTVVDFSAPYEGWLDLLAGTGIRACVAPIFRDASWSTRDGHSIQYDWSDAGAGPRGLTAAQNMIDAASAHRSGRLSGLIAPAQIDTVSEGLLRDAHSIAQARNVPMQLHAAQSINEFHELVRRHGHSPIQWMNEIGVLDERTIIAHGIFLDHHPWLHWSSQRDMPSLADCGASIAHCPTVFMRRGIALNTFGRYLSAGINLGIGTDTYPMNMLEEMRHAGSTARLVAGTVDDLSSGDIFNAATIGGAKALHRDDIGRLHPGAKSDLAIIDLQHPSMRPVREPLRSLMYVAAERAVRDVYVDGQLVVKNGQCLTVDLDSELDGLEQAQQRSIQRAPGLDYAGRSVDQMSPPVFERYTLQ